MKYNILVTGCGGDIGQSIGKILNDSVYVNQLYGCDISDKNAAKFIYPDFLIGLPCSHPDYINNLASVIESNKVSLVLPIAELELRFFADKHNLQEIAGAKIIAASSKALSVGFDKLKTADFLASENLPFPMTHLIEDIEVPEKFPVVLKSRTGSGSSTVNVVRDVETFEFIRRRNPDYIVQEYVDEKSGEYTCGVFRSSKGVIRIIVLKRELTGGYSGYGEVVSNSHITDLLQQIAIKLDLIGSINVQLRLNGNSPLVFEINPRFSSTVLFRHMFGFKDVEWSIEDKLDLPLSLYTENSVSKKFYKGYQEYIN